MTLIIEYVPRGCRTRVETATLDVADIEAARNALEYRVAIGCKNVVGHLLDEDGDVTWTSRPDGTEIAYGDDGTVLWER